MSKALPSVAEDDFDSFDEEEISLTAAQIAEAVKVSDRIIDRELQWQIYMNALAVAVFTSWVQERDDELKVERVGVASPLENRVCTCAPKIPAAYLKISGFKVCVMAKGALDGDYVNIPHAIVNNPADPPHFYIVVEVLEEIAQALMYGFIRCDRLQQYLQAEPLETFSDGTCDLPIGWLNLEFDELLSYLRCFNPNAIPIKLVAAENQQVASAEVNLIDLKGCWNRILHRTGVWSDLASQLKQRLDLPPSTRSTLYWQGSICSYLISLFHDYINFG
jgi:Protein of unknown function (DUF1822)